MNQTRSFLLIAWLVVAGFLYMEWAKRPVDGTAAPVASGAGTMVGSTAPADSGAPLPGMAASAPLPGPAPSPLAAASSAATPAPAVLAPITLANDRLRITVDLHGGRLVDSQLLQYTVEKKAGSPNVRLLNSSPSLYHVATAGLINVSGNQVQRELDPQFRTESGASDFSIAAGAPAVHAVLLWTDPASGVTVQRTLTLDRYSYVLDVSDTLANGSATAQRIYPFVSLSRVAPPPPPKHSFMTNPETFSFIGAAWHTPEQNYEKAKLSDFSDEKPTGTNMQGSWIAMLQHHFATAWVPLDKEKQVRLETTVGSHDGVPLYSIRSIAAPLDIAPGSSSTHETRLWVGPKLQTPMSALAPTLSLTVDYGVLAFIGKPLYWLLSALHGLLGNWGWAIIAIVVLLKLALYPLSAKQYQSMAKMRAVQPRLEALKERYGEDKQAFQMAMMELYKKEKINPIGGCLPMLIPIPIFLGLYWVLLETVELRHAPWIGWIQNLTAADPYFILPALNLLVMFLTQKLTPMPGMDPLQKKMMQFMPLVFGVMMAFFPAGLVLYWVTNGFLGLLQQWWMTKKHGPRTAVVAK